MVSNMERQNAVFPRTLLTFKEIQLKIRTSEQSSLVMILLFSTKLTSGCPQGQGCHPQKARVWERAEKSLMSAKVRGQNA